MIFADLLAAHRSQLGKAIDRFREPDRDADLQRHLGRAARWIDQRWPYTQQGELSLTAMVSEYPAPTGCLGVYGHDWGRNAPFTPWMEHGTGYPPLLDLIYEAAGPVLWVSPPPTAMQIQAWGSVMRYRYRRMHTISPTAVSVGDEHLQRVLLAALIEAMRELAAETASTQLHKGMSGIPTAGTPAYLYEALLREWDRLP